jgi:hypothetical protein
LEDRTVPTIVLNGTTLDITGTGGNDIITLSQNSGGGVFATLDGQTASFSPGQVTGIYVATTNGINTVNVLATPAGVSTTINGDGFNVVTVGNYNSGLGNGHGYMGNIQGSVDVYGNGTTDLDLDDSGDGVGQNVTMSDGQINYGGAAPIYYTPASILPLGTGVGQLQVVGGYGGNTFNVESTSNFDNNGLTNLNTGNGNDTVNVHDTGGPLDVYNPGGSDTTNVGFGNLGISGTGSLTLSGSGSNNLYVNDSSDPNYQVYDMGNSSPGFGSISTDGTYPGGSISYEYSETNNVTLQTGTRSGNVINVDATGGSGVTNIVANANAIINVGNTTVSGITDTLNIENPSAFNTVLIHDSADTTARTATLQNIGANPNDSEGNNDPWGQVSGLGGANINYEYDDTGSLTLQTGTASGNVINVLATKGGPTNIVTGAATTINVGNGTVSGILGTLNLESPPNFNTIVLNDASDTTARTVTIQNIGANPADSQGNSDSWGQVSGLASANINYEYGDTRSLTIDGSKGASTYNIQGTGGAFGSVTTVNAGVGSDTFNLGVGNSLSGLQGAVTINGGGGTNILNANDSSSATGQSYSLSLTQLVGTDFATITYAYASLHAINVTGSGNDTLTLLTPAPAVATTFNGGSGTNTLVGPNATTTWTISGANSGKVGNLTFSNFQNLQGGTGSDAFDLTTSTASLSGTLNGGGGTNNNNTLSYATLGSSYLVSVTLTSNTAGSATHIGGGFSNINTLVGSTDTANTLKGPNSTNQWTITGNNAGNVNTGPTRPFVFTNMAHLVGGTGVDTFRMDSSSDKVLGINGGGAPAGQGDWLKYSLFPSSSTVTVNLAAGSATDVNGGAAGSVTGIQNVLGSATGTNNLTGDSQGNILIGGSGLNTIVGGSGSSLLIGGSGHGSITGGSGTDILIAGTTTYSASTLAGEDSLMAILAELQSADTFAQKVSDITNGNASGGGHDLNGSNKLTWGGTVRASTGAFTLKGDTSSSSKPDWFFSNSSSTVTDFNDDGVQDEHNNNAIGVF